MDLTWSYLLPGHSLCHGHCVRGKVNLVDPRGQCIPDTNSWALQRHSGERRSTGLFGFHLPIDVNGPGLQSNTVTVSK